MKNFLTSLIFSIGCLLVHAQENRFIYLQTENREPFFVKFNNKILNSSALGYLIIPKLDEGLYSLIIGFPGSTYEQEFNCSVKNKDVGFIIKSAGQGQLQLLNVQTLNVIIPGDVIAKPVIIYDKVTDAFSTMLANAVNDSTILRKDVLTQIFAEKPEETTPKDSAGAIVPNPEGVVSKDNIIDSTSTAIAKETQTEKANEVIQKDSLQPVVPKSEPVIAMSDEVPKTDSIKSEIAKEILPVKTSEQILKDTAGITNPIAVNSRPDEVRIDSIFNKDIAKETPPETLSEIIKKDSIQTESTQEIAVTKSKKKKSKKNDNALLDATGNQSDVVKSTDNHRNESSSVNDIALLRTSIKRKSKKSGKDGLVMMYIDDIGDTNDTIRVLIPSEKKMDEEVKITGAVASIPSQQDGKPNNNVRNKKKGYKITSAEKEIINEVKKEPVFISTMINSDCKNFATEEDFLKMRKKMVAENNDENMIKAARKIFKTRCFTTEQIKNLSVLFLKDESRYMFFDAAYPFVSDSDQYSSLEKQLTDNFYITRFRAMINK